MKRGKGHPRNIETPEDMYDLFEKYRSHVATNPRVKYQLSQRTGEMIPEYLKVPLTMEGFENFCYDKVGVIEQYFKNQQELYGEYIHICARIRKEIRQDQIEGGMVGQYNPSITQRLNGLVEKVEQTNIERPIFNGIDLNVAEDNGTE
jgi:hypothetical protein